MTLAAEAFMRVTAWRKVSLPRMARVARRSWAFSAVVGQREPPPGIWSRSCREPSEPISVARTEPSPFPRGGLEHGCPGAVPEQDAGAAVLPVDDGGKFFRGDDESRFHLAGADVLNGGLHGEQEAGAGGGNVKGGGILGAKGILDVAGSGRGERIRRDGGDDNQVNILRLQPAGFQSALGGLRPHMGSVLVRGGDAAFHNARAFNNPFVGSVHHLLQIRIGQAAFRNIGTRTDNLDGQSFKGNIRMCGHSFGRMMNRKRPDVLCGNSLKERGPDDQHKTQDSFHVVNEWLTTATPGRWRAARLPS